MKHWSEYKGHKKTISYKHTKSGFERHDETIYSFDIETSSVLLHEHKVYPVDMYSNFSDVTPFGYLYIWMFSINDTVYYGRTLEEFVEFKGKVFNTPSTHSVVYVHNLAFEFQFLRSVLKIDDVFARDLRKPMYFEEGNIRFKCSYYLTGASLEKLPSLYNLPVQKMSGDLDYSLIRTPETPLTDKEMKYCENDCLVIYELIKKFLAEYKYLRNIPLTKTGILRKKTKKALAKKADFGLRCKELNRFDPELYNALVKAFAGGYTHANVIYSEQIIENVYSFDESSAYPFVMCCEKVFPKTAFTKSKVKYIDDLDDNKVYVLHCRLSNIESKKYNTTMSFHKCYKTHPNHLLDNGRIEYMESCEMYLTHIDLKTFSKFYTFECEILEAWESPASYLPKSFIEYILNIYEMKTKLKGVKGKEEEYGRAKSDFNSLYGMCVTNDIRDEILYENSEWLKHELTKEEVAEKLKEKAEKEEQFLTFSWGVFVTAQARANLLECVSLLDEHNVYSDTDSLKLKEGFDNRIINRYNLSVYRKIRKAKEELGLSGFIEKDIEGNVHPLGIFEFECKYDKFITIGAKKYCVENTREYSKYRISNGKIYDEVENTSKSTIGITITVAGVPKKTGSKVLTSIDDFKEGMIFKGTETGKNCSFYSEEKDVNLTVEDYLGNIRDVHFSYGLAIVPCDYTLSASSKLDDIENTDFFINRRLA